MNTSWSDILDLMDESEIRDALQETLEENLNGFEEIDFEFLASQLNKTVTRILFDTYEQNEIKQAIRRTTDL